MPSVSQKSMPARNEVSWSMAIASKEPSAYMALASGPALWCRSPPAYTGGGT